ncbi:ribonuclease E inhibitor B [Providencia rettgeri]|uniref:Regulator of ribonuclease activity B n=2 Tax=Providencia rettgeri TaxID=587 RepID=A0A264VT82_PRORE|nr:ribonuclease E inhibitor B [Providencia rettgeri]THB29725.1 ribonuclease E inhibitor RraB [Providencia sp. MGF014]
MVSLSTVWENGAKKDERQRNKRGVDMVDKAELDAQYEETRLIIEELLEDGSDPDALYAIEHHFSADNFALLEKAAVEAFKLGYEVTDAEELEIETGETLMCCDVISESALNAELIDAQVEQLMKLAEKMGINYDGWGTYFEDPDAEYDDEDGDDVDPEDRVH